VYIILIEGYNWKKIIIALKTKSAIHFETIVFFLAKTTLILKRRECNE